MSRRVLLFAAYGLLSLGVVVALYFSNEKTDQLRGQLCVLLNNSAKGLPSNPYFHDHPDRLRAALANVRQSRADLHCKPPVK